MNLQPLLESSAAQTRVVADAFLAACDQKQPFTQWVMPQTSVVWNGSPLAGPDALAQMIAQTPTTVHSIGGFNCHPLPNNNVAVTVSGQVTFGEANTNARSGSAYAFSAFFVMVQIPNGPLAIQTMTYRLVHKPNDSILVH